jgi:hypothetical protein
MGMKIRLLALLLPLLTTEFLTAQSPARLAAPPNPRVVDSIFGTDKITVVHVRPGYVTAVRVPEEVSSVVIGDPKNFSAEHIESEPQLVFVRPLLNKPSETNVLITTKVGHEVSLHLVSNGTDDVDFVLDFHDSRANFLVPASLPSFAVAETKTVTAEMPTPTQKDPSGTAEGELKEQMLVSHPRWEGQQLQVAVGRLAESGTRMVVSFSVLNNSDSTIELLPPQIQLSELGKARKAKADQVPIDGYGVTQRKLGPRERADGVLLFERPAFKQADEQLFLQIVQAQAVDRPVLVPLSFSSPKKEELSESK